MRAIRFSLISVVFIFFLLWGGNCLFARPARIPYVKQRITDVYKMNYLEELQTIEDSIPAIQDIEGVKDALLDIVDLLKTR